MVRLGGLWEVGGASKLRWGWEIGLGVGGDWLEGGGGGGGSLTDEPPGSGIHALVRDLVEMPAGFELEECDKVGRVNQGFVFGSLRGIETTFVRALAENFDPRLHRLIDTECDQTSSRFRVEAEAQRFQKAVKACSLIHALTLSQPMKAAEKGFTVVWRP